MSHPKPRVRKLHGTLWVATVTRGFSGNYESDSRLFHTWREAFDWAHGTVKNWRQG